MQIILDEVKRHIHTVPIEKLPMFLGALAAMTAEVQLRMMMGQDSVPVALPEPGPYLTVEEVCTRFHVTKQWVYRHKRHLPHSQPSRKKLIFPQQKLERYFATRQGA